MSGKEPQAKRQRTSSTSMTSTCTTFSSSNCHLHIMNMFSNTMHFQYCLPLFSHYYSHPNSTTAINTTSSIMTSTATQTQTHHTDVKDTQRLENKYCRMSNKESKTGRKRTSSSSSNNRRSSISFVLQFCQKTCHKCYAYGGRSQVVKALLSHNCT